MTETRTSPILSDADHARVLARIEELMLADPDTPEMDELEALVQHLVAYEDERWPIGKPSPAAAIEFRLGQLGLSRRDLEPYLGGPDLVAEVLSGRRLLTAEMIRALHVHFGISVEVLSDDGGS